MENNYKKIGHMLSKEGEVVPSTRGMGSQLKKMLTETKGSSMDEKAMNWLKDSDSSNMFKDAKGSLHIAKKEGMITDETPLQGDSSGDGPSYDTENPMMKIGDKIREKVDKFKENRKKKKDEKAEEAGRVLNSFNSPPTLHRRSNAESFEKKGKGKKDPRYKDMSQEEIDAKVKTHYTGEGDEKETKNDAIKRFNEENPDYKPEKKKIFQRKIKAKF